MSSAVVDAKPFAVNTRAAASTNNWRTSTVERRERTAIVLA
jgi:hypothetical protein